MSETLGIRPDLKSVSPYVSPQLPARVRLNTNESPYPPPEELVDDISAALRAASLNRYPDRDANELLDGLAAATGWERDGLWIANGSNEVFLHLFLTYGGVGRKLLVFEPTYPLHRLIAEVTSTQVLSSERGPEWGVTSGSVDDAIQIERPDIVVFCSPNNPTGAVEDRSAVLRALEVAPLVVVDEAYIEFAPDDSSVADLLSAHPNLVIARTFSKAWSLAGVRLGYLMGSPQIVAEMARVKLPYHLSTPAQAAGVAALKYGDRAAGRISQLRSERDRISGALSDRGLVTYASDANFVLFETGLPDALPTWSALLERGVLVRNYAAHPRLGGALRVTAGAPTDTDAFLEALAEVMTQEGIT